MTSRLPHGPVASILIAAVLTASRLVAAPLVLDPGGLSIDFRGAGGTPVAGEEMLPNGDMEEADPTGMPVGWQTDSYVWLPVDDPLVRATMLERESRSRR